MVTPKSGFLSSLVNPSPPSELPTWSLPVTNSKKNGDKIERHVAWMYTKCYKEELFATKGYFTADGIELHVKVGIKRKGAANSDSEYYAVFEPHIDLPGVYLDRDGMLKYAKRWNGYEVEAANKEDYLSAIENATQEYDRALYRKVDRELKEEKEEKEQESAMNLYLACDKLHEQLGEKDVEKKKVKEDRDTKKEKVARNLVTDWRGGPQLTALVRVQC